MTQPYPFDCLPVHPPPQPLESFTGYMIRLGELNQVRSISALRTLLFADLSFRPHLHLHNTDTLSRAFPRFAAAAHCAVERLQATTTAHLVTKFGCKVALPFLQNSLADGLRYCPDCLDETGYYRLDWRFLALPGCERHKKRLLDRCGRCGQVIPLLNPCLRIGICPHCQADLRLGDAPFLSDDECRLTQLRTPDLAYLLTPQAWETDAPAIRASAGAWLSCQRREQKLSSVRLARQLGVPQPRVRSIESLQARREGVCFQLYLAYADALKTSWSATFAYVSQQSDLPQTATQLWAQRLLQQVEQAIDHLEQSGQPLSKMAVGRAVNLSPECLVLYPGVKPLMETLPERARQQAEQRWLRTAQTAIADLQHQRQPITRNSLYQRVPRLPRTLTRYPELRRFLARYLPADTLRARPPRTHPHQAALLQHLTTLTPSLAAQDQRVTLPLLARVLGISPAIVYGDPTLHAQITAVRQFCALTQRQRTEARFLQQAQQVVSDLTQHRQRCSIQAICQALGKPYGVLAKYPRLYALFQAVKAPPGWAKTAR